MILKLNFSKCTISNSNINALMNLQKKNTNTGVLNGNSVIKIKQGKTIIIQLYGTGKKIVSKSFDLCECYRHHHYYLLNCI